MAPALRADKSTESTNESIFKNDSSNEQQPHDNEDALSSNEENSLNKDEKEKKETVVDSKVPAQQDTKKESLLPFETKLVDASLISGILAGMSSVEGEVLQEKTKEATPVTNITVDKEKNNDTVLGLVLGGACIACIYMCLRELS